MSIKDLLTNPAKAITDTFKPYLVRGTLILVGLIFIMIALHGLTSDASNPVTLTIEGVQSVNNKGKKKVGTLNSSVKGSTTIVPGNTSKPSKVKAAASAAKTKAVETAAAA
jgi:hypothetical protein